MRTFACLFLPLVLTACHSSVASSSNATGGPACLGVESGFGVKGAVPVRAETVVSGLEVPWGIAFLPGGDFLVTERPGRVRRVRAGKLVAAPVATIEVGASAESGLLGIALDPTFAQTRAFFLYMTVDAPNGRVNRVERWQLAEDGASARREGILVDGIPAAKYHDGGRLRVGPDGMLYVGTGDARDPDLSQKVASPAGKILRVTPEGKVPSDNPFQGSASFVLGIRNTQGFDWADEKTLWVTDHGPSGELLRTGHDEVSVARAGSNLGWPGIYGCERKDGQVTPAITWKKAAPPGGAAIYRGERIPEWKGSLIIGTLGSEHLQRVVLKPDGTVARHEVYFEGELGRLREVAMAPDGNLYVTTSNCDGRGDCGPEKDRIVRIVPAGG